MKGLQILLFVIVLTGAGTGVYIYLGIYNFAADEPHFSITEDFIDYVRDRSIEARTLNITVPANLHHEPRIIRGAGHYDAMCVGCHLKPGLDNTEMRKGLYPRPPNLSRHADDPGEQFWVIRHGIKMTGMPAWGKGGISDEAIWDMVALLQVLPGMSAEKYAAYVTTSEGHDHDSADSRDKHESPADALPLTNTGEPELGNVTTVPDEQEKTDNPVPTDSDDSAKTEPDPEPVPVPDNKASTP